MTAITNCVRFAWLVLCVLAFVACNGADENGMERTEIVTVPVTSPLNIDTSTTVSYVCQIQAIQHIELRALESGYLQEIMVDEGQHVSKGQQLFQILPTVYQAELQEAKAEASLVDIEYQNTKNLLAKNIVSESELALVQSRLDKAQAHVVLAKARVDFSRIHAPFSGVVDRLRVRRGSLLEEGETLTELSDNSQMWVYFNVPESQYLAFMARSFSHSDSSVALRLANGMIYNQAGVISAIEANFDNTTGNIAFRATFPNPSRLLRHGQTGQVLMKQSLNNALLIPQKATFEVLDKKYVFVVDKNGIVKTRKIQTGAELDHVFAVTSGLSKTDKFVIDGIRKIRDGQRVRVKFMDPAATLSNLSLFAE